MQVLNLVTNHGFKIVVVLLILCSVLQTFDGRFIYSGNVPSHVWKKTAQRSKRYTLSIPKMHLCQRSFQRCGNGHGNCEGHCPPGIRNFCSRSRGYCIPVRARSG